MDWELSFLMWIQEHIVNGFLTPIMKAFTTLGNGGILWIIIIVLLILFPKTRKLGIICAVTLIVDAILCNLVLKPLFERARPFTEIIISLEIPIPMGNSFPSGHTSSSFAVATAIFLAHKKLGIAALAVASIIAFSRMYFFVHYPTDILAGMILGILCAVVVSAIFNHYSKKKELSTSGNA
ncbi:MAG TPA: phosphatase PAP2 family protein [Firmicutes bacterium]|nr:phosphatase PAP2 family protein [Bacillota bacterium]